MLSDDELRALADALEPMARAPRFEDFDVPGFCAWLRQCAEQRPAAYKHTEPDGSVAHFGADEAPCEKCVPLYAAPVPPVQPAREWAIIDAAICEYLNDYEMLGEDDTGADAYYIPTGRERELIYDAINGLLGDEQFIRLIAAAPVPQQRDLSPAERDVLDESLRKSVKMVARGKRESFVQEAGEPPAFTLDADANLVVDRRTLVASGAMNRQLAAASKFAALVPQQREPLSDDKIEELWEAAQSETDNFFDVHGFARAVERAHGIGGSDER